MKIQELRDLLKNADRSRLEKAFAECYKHVPKSRKEMTDQMIADIFAGRDGETSGKRNVLHFTDLELEIVQFLDHAYAQYYCVPNKSVPENRRPKWRFMVRNYIKELGKIPVEDENYPRSARLLRDLYHLLCEACNTYLFSTKDPFRSVGWEQQELFGLVVKKVFGDGYSEAKIASLLADAAGGGLSREALHIYQERVLLAELNTSDVKYMAITAAKRLIEEKNKKLDRLMVYDRKRYCLEGEINNLCGMILMTAAELAEAASGIEYYFCNCMRKDKETILYHALVIAEQVENDGLWRQIYEYGTGMGIKPKESLLKKYRAMCCSG